MELSKVQQEAVDFYRGCCNVIASAGSGKTRVLVNRIVKLIEEYDVEPGKILAITFSKKAKENMIERLTKMIPEYVNFINIETFHSFGYRIVRQFTREQFEILDADWKKVKIIEEIMQSVYRTKEVDGEEVAEILHYISVQKNQMKKPDTREKFGKFYKKYEDYKSAHNQLDFDDMLTKCYEILVSNEKGLAYCQDKYQFILADEMQDTNAVQYEILKLIGAKYKNVFVVDDPLQNIFQWRGSDNRFVLEFDQEWPDAKTIQLNKNYRSSLNIVRAANHFAEYIPESGHVHYVESVADKGEFEEPHYDRFIDETTEAAEISKRVKELVDAGYHYNDIAVLTRTNAQLQYFETALYRSEIPYTVVDGLSFSDRKEIKIVLSYLRLVCDINDDEAFEYIYNRPNRFLGSQFLQEVKRAARKEKISLFCAMSRVIKTNWRYKSANSIYGTVKQLSGNHYKTVADMIADLREILDLDSYVSKDLSENDDSKVENLNTLQSMASNYKDVKRFVSFMMKFAKEKKTDPNSVQLMTIHKSKGLEFPIVFVDSLGNVPRKSYKDILNKIEGRYYHRETFEPYDEMKLFDFWRLYYTAFSRAQDLLVLTCNEDKKTPSKYIKEVYGELQSVEALDLSEFTFHTVKSVNLKNTFSFTSHIAVYETCALQYKFYKELEFMPIRQGAMLFGTLVHETIEDVHRAALRHETEKITKDNITSWFDSNYISLIKTEHGYLAEAQRKVALNQVLRYVERQHGNWSAIQQAEVDVSLVQPDYIIEGKIDLVKGENGTVELVDFKSEKKPDMEKMRERLEHYRRQLHIYAYLIEQRTGQKVSKMHLYYTGEENGNPMISFPYTKSAIDGTVAAFDDTVHKILKKDFRSCSNDPRTCSNCDFRYYCQK